jgi:hypothetical protein
VITGPALDAAILALPSRPRRDTYFRATPYLYASDPLGKQRPIHAQRFNVAGGSRVLYLGDDQITCLHEARALGFPASAVTIVPVQFDLAAVVDLRDPAVQTILQTNAAEISFNFRSLSAGASPAFTQLLGEQVAASGRIDGLLYKSPARKGHLDLAVIENALTSLGSSLVVNDLANKLTDHLP